MTVSPHSRADRLTPIPQTRSTVPWIATAPTVPAASAASAPISVIVLLVTAPNVMVPTRGDAAFPIGLTTVTGVVPTTVVIWPAAGDAAAQHLACVPGDALHLIVLHDPHHRHVLVDRGEQLH